jgi:small subunit ribosomal protein S20
MANHKSALKRIKQSLKKYERNKVVRTGVKKVVKDLKVAVAEGSAEKSAEIFKIAKSVITKASNKKVIHKNTASRKISRLSKMVKSI